MRCLKLLYSKNKISEIAITAAFALLVIVMMAGLLPLSETIRFCDMTRSAFTETDHLIYYSATTSDEMIFGKTQTFGISDVELPYDTTDSFFSTSLYNMHTYHANTGKKGININLIRYFPVKWKNLDRLVYGRLEENQNNDMVSILITQDLVDKYGFVEGDRFEAIVKTGTGSNSISKAVSFYVAGILGEDDPILYIRKTLSSKSTMGHISVDRGRYRDDDVSFAVTLDPGGLLPEDSEFGSAALISVPKGEDPVDLAKQLNLKYAAKAKFVPYTEIEVYTIGQSWEGNSFSLLLLITLGIVLLTSFTGFTVTKTDRMRQTIKNLYINGLSRTKILALFFTYYMTLIVPAFAIGLVVFPVLAAEEFHGYNPLIITGSALLFAFFLLAGTLITLFSLRKNLIITYDKA